MSEEYPTLPKEYWPCPLTLIELLEIHGTGRSSHSGAYDALFNSGLVEPWVDGRFQTTERGRKFVQMLVEVPLPEMRWVDPREDIGRGGRN